MPRIPKGCVVENCSETWKEGPDGEMIMILRLFRVDNQGNPTGLAVGQVVLSSSGSLLGVKIW